MNILEVCFSPALGGLELYCLRTAKQLQSRGHEVHIWLAEGSRMVDHPISRELNVSLFKAPARFDPRFLVRAGNLIRKQRIEVMHLHRSRDLASFSLLRRNPRLLTLQIESRLHKKDPLHRFYYARLDRLLTITERMRGFASEALPVDPGDIFTLHYGLDVDSFMKDAGDKDSFLRQYDIPNDAILVGLIGRLEESKGQHILLRAFADIYRQKPEVYIFIVGETPPEGSDYDASLKNLANTLGVSDRVRFVKFQTDLSPVYSALDIFVLASREEAFGLVLLEAMAFGLPIIATNAGGVPEIIQNNLNGLLVEPHNPEALSDALNSLIDDPKLRRGIGTKGYEIVRERFSIKKHLEALESHFADIIAADNCN
ncbi:hypothetical protein CEE37_04025 [candidate division LCP-89 bacterium B3_LCP]|uniref:Glycosyl transferase n=1 Tax=candidate division LCP-89 bacterium B3_LCP TaxID=2012998 RepID=A0A532V3I0_UNCL8|nr:MAG: hypothetical protein CEE37_04025 [candidate division LCP-89 bacterium B3_LCP]